MILNENRSDQGLRIGDILYNSNGQRYEILEVNGHNYLLKSKSGNFVIALGYDSKSKEWASGKYFNDDKNGAYKMWKDQYSKRNSFGVDLGESVNEAAGNSSKLSSLLKSLDDFADNFARAAVGLKSRLQIDGSIDIDKFIIKDAKEFISKHSKALLKIAEEISKMTPNSVVSESLGINENRVSNKISPAIDDFLQDVAEMTGHISYNDIIKLGRDKNLDSKLTKLKKLRSAWYDAADDDNDIAMMDVGRSVKRIINESAQDSLYFDNTVKYDNDDIAAQISINYEGESNAITGYYKLLPFLKSAGDQGAIDQIVEIISDEKNHQQILKDLSMKYDGGIPVAKD